MFNYLLYKTLYLLQGFDPAQYPAAIFDILILAVIFYYLYVFLRGTRAYSIILGLIFFVLLYLFSGLLNLVALNWLLGKALTLLAIAIPIVFQKELRLGLEKIGRGEIFRRHRQMQGEKLLDVFKTTARLLARRRIGALIVLQRQTPLDEYLVSGVPLGSEISRELLLSIFNPKGPLHDGAVILNENKILAASCILPLSTEVNDRSLGTRHKSAIGLSESTDALVIVVSEQRGAISLAYQGRLVPDLTPERLVKLLRQILGFEAEEAKEEKKKLKTKKKQT